MIFKANQIGSKMSHEKNIGNCMLIWNKKQWTNGMKSKIKIIVDIITQ